MKTRPGLTAGPYIKDMDLKQKLKQQKKRKYALIGIGILVLVCIIGAFASIESKDTKLADGQGNQYTAEVESQDVDTSDDSTEKGSVSADKVKKMSDAEKAKIKSKDIKIDNSKDPTASNEGNEALKPKTPKNVSVTVEIRCDAVSNNMDALENKSIKDYIPKDGVILAKTTYKGTTENTVFDAINTICRNKNIQVEYHYTPGFDTYYIEGINYLYEKDCGYQSGWLYKVNGWMPNYGCSNYYLRDGDIITWEYSIHM